MHIWRVKFHGSEAVISRKPGEWLLSGKEVMTLDRTHGHSSGMTDIWS